MHRFLLSIAFLLAISSAALGQRTIHGKVTDPDTGEGIIGANVVVKGTTLGTVTDYDGSYSIIVPDSATTIAISYTGYDTVEMPITDSDVIDVAIGEGKLLNEVVLIGYGTVKREDATGSVQSVSSVNFNKGAITAPQELLAGKVPGVVVLAPDGAPGAGATIRIRGESSIGASNDPLIVIDGVPVDNGGVSGGRNPLNVINPNDIETFTVLKDASAAAIYGNRAAAGVILITTKKGAVGKKLRIGYTGNISTSEATDLVDALHADEYRALLNSRPDSAKAAPLVGDASTYWQDEIYQTAIGTDHNLYATGGLGIVPFRVSLEYTNKEGILKTDKFEKVSAAVNLNPGFLDNTLQVNLHFKSSFTHNRFADRGAIGNALNFDPTQSIYDTLSPYGGFTTWTETGGAPNTLGPTNPLALLTLKDDESDEKRYLTNLALDYRIPFLPDLRANLNLAYDYANGQGTVDVDTLAAFAYNAITGGGQHNIYEQTKKNSLLEFYLNYKKTFGDHSFDVLAGYSWQHFEVRNTYTNSDAAGSPTQTTSADEPSEYFLISQYGRLNYGYKNRYLLTLTLRRDGTSRFSPENRWGLFPAAAVAVKVIENNNNNFNSLKVRLGWGVTGQQDINNDFYAYLARYQYGIGNFARYQLGDEFITTLRPDAYDEKIHWEETETYNIGFDFSIINNRLSGSLDLYQRNTTDLLNRIPVPAGTNLSNFVTTNIGNMENKGVEIAFVTTPVLTKKVTWDFGINAAWNDNEITKLTATDDPNYQGVLTGGIAGGVGSNIQIYTVGYAPKSFFVYKQLYDENGDIIENSFEDLNNDGIINGQDKYRFKKPAADVTLGFTSRLAIGNFDFSFAGRASLGNYVYNNIQTDMGYLMRLYGTSGVLWNVNQSAVDLNTENQASLTFSDHFVKKADFLKMDHITVGYNFDKVIGDFLRVYATVQNPIVSTSYDGLDPEVRDGIDNNIYPRPRTFVFGVNVEF